MAADLMDLAKEDQGRYPADLAGRRPTWAVIDLEALSGNLSLIRRIAGKERRILAVVKADAYGHGAVPVARRLVSDGADLLGVASIEEGLELRRSGIPTPVQVLGATTPDQLPAAASSALGVTAYSLSSLDAILAQGKGPGPPLPFHLKLDTGMGRLGLQPQELSAALERLTASRGRAFPEGVFTTLACSDDPEAPQNTAQIDLFRESIESIRAAGIKPLYVHVANSGGILHQPRALFDTVRPGILLYGIHPSGRSQRVALRPVLSFRTKVLQVKTVAAGTALGYGGSFVTSRPSRIGTLPVGYADGLERLASDGGCVLVRGRRARFTGWISMDHAMVDLTDVNGAAEGDQAVIIGRQGPEQITADEVARWSRTIPYEVVCRIGRRVPRIYRDSPAGEAVH